MHAIGTGTPVTPLAPPRARCRPATMWCMQHGTRHPATYCHSLSHTVPLMCAHGPWPGVTEMRDGTLGISNTPLSCTTSPRCAQNSGLYTCALPDTEHTSALLHIALRGYTILLGVISIAQRSTSPPQSSTSPPQSSTSPSRRRHPPRPGCRLVRHALARRRRRRRRRRRHRCRRRPPPPPPPQRCRSAVPCRGSARSHAP